MSPSSEGLFFGHFYGSIRIINFTKDRELDKKSPTTLNGDFYV
jgi:hypothetical protein